ncbi:sensor histidine kinase [Streptomyces sp. NPDC091281]|uniref:sensor histidine kinase n=1 Tax=Streptomyces sp. NPDC091281 TaxID=3365985 RepID=UPI0037F63739
MSSPQATWTARAAEWAPRVRAGLPPAAADALLVAVLLPLTTAAVAGRTVAVASSAALLLPLAARRRAPLAVFGAVAAAAFAQWLLDLQLPADVALLVALYSVAVYASPRALVVAAAVLEGGIVLAALRWATDGRLLGTTVALTALAATAAAVGLNVRAQRERAVRMERERDQRARLAAAEERAHITREMHDIVTHNLSVMVALADAAAFTAPRPADPATVTMSRIAETGRQALTDMRRVLDVLQPDGAQHDAKTGEDRRPPPGITGLAPLADRTRAAGLPVTLDVRGDHAHVPATAQLTVHRIVQEALTNTLKHAPPGTEARVTVHCTARTVTVDVTDDGPAARPSAPASTGHGLPGLRERAAAYGGTLTAGPREGGGWRVRTRLDLGSAEERETPATRGTGTVGTARGRVAPATGRAG